MENNMKKIFALILALSLLVFVVACDDDNVSGDVEIDVSGGGFFDDPVDTADTDAVDTGASTGDAADTDSDTEDTADTEAAE